MWAVRSKRTGSASFIVEQSVDHLSQTPGFRLQISRKVQVYLHYRLPREMEFSCWQTNAAVELSSRILSAPKGRTFAFLPSLSVAVTRSWCKNLVSYNRQASKIASALPHDLIHSRFPSSALDIACQSWVIHVSLYQDSSQSRKKVQWGIKSTAPRDNLVNTAIWSILLS